MVNFISLSLKEIIINSSQLFMSPFSADTLRNCLFRLLNNCDCYKFTATPCALNMHLECWPPAVFVFVYPLHKITHSSFYFIFYCKLFVWAYRGTEAARPAYMGNISPLTLGQLNHLIWIHLYLNKISHQEIKRYEDISSDDGVCQKSYHYHQKSVSLNFWVLVKNFAQKLIFV